MVDRGDVRSVRKLLGIVIALLGLCLLSPPSDAGDGQPCEVVPTPCMFEGLPFQFKVVDAGTQKPIASVHALAEWRTYSAGGRLNGPLMAQDAVSAVDGVLSFPAWGPVRGPVSGLGIGNDPIITLFKAGYKPLMINNADPPGTKETQRVRRFYQDGRAYALERFQGTSEEWIKELRRIYRGVAFPRGDDQSLQFRE